MIRKALAWITAATVAVLMCLPGTAHATMTWVPASCAVGSFESATVDARGHYLMAAHMALCEPYQPGLNYEVVLFLPGGFLPLATGDKLLPYLASGPAKLKIDVNPVLPMPEFGLCLMRDVDTRTACVRVDTTTATSTPIAVDDSLVAEQVMFLTRPPVNLPTYCATCVTVALG